jgi:hypothetical protein
MLPLDKLDRMATRHRIDEIGHSRATPGLMR